MNNYLIPAIAFDEPTLISGKGSYLEDSLGKKYLDLNAGQFCSVLGNANDEVLVTISQSLTKLSHTSTKMVSNEVLRAAQQLNHISGPMNAYSILLSTGAEVIEFCLRYAKAITGRDGVVCFDRGYHGLTLGAQSITYSGVYTKPHVSETYNIPIAEGDGTNFDESLTALESILTSKAIAAVVFEPIVSVGGMLFPPADWFHRVRALCDQYGALLVLDECQTGFGRTGDWFAYLKYGFTPDMVATAKGAGLGFPVAVAMFRDKLIPKNGTYSITHYSSHQNDPFAATVINAGIDYIEKYDVLNRVTEVGAYFLTALKQLETVNPHIVKSRGLGLMLGADLDYSGLEDYRQTFANLYDTMLQNGVIIQGTNGGRTLRFLPDYLISPADIDLACSRLNRALNEVAPNI